eukprot:TRINITY_DN2753_c1_g1_i1.p1 TRINITY_DN2753_c1_g1~~TRINITY_DN2753_c1_g1_i1.p1  ORF type:complete len:764 (+),score=174.15 TRINITY_DN2753_c1_g1_i1:56-2293(+)
MDEEERLLVNLLKAEEKRTARKERRKEVSARKVWDEKVGSMREVYEAAGLGVGVARMLDLDGTTSQTPQTIPPPLRTPEKIAHTKKQEPMYPEELVAATATPHKNIRNIQQELIKLVSNGCLGKEDDVASFKSMLSRCFTLTTTPEKTCRLTKTDDRVCTDQFSGDAAVSTSINISEAMERWHAAHSVAAISAHKATQMSSRLTEMLLLELETGLSFGEDNNNNNNPPQRPTSAKTPVPHCEEFSKLKSMQINGLGPKIEEVLRMAEKLTSYPYQHNVLNDVLERVHTAVGVAGKAVHREWLETHPQEEKFDLNLTEELASLKVEQEKEKAGGRLDASAKLKVQALEKTAEWLEKSVFFNEKDTQTTVDEVGEAGENLELTISAYETVMASASQNLIKNRAEVMASEGFLRNKDARNRQETTKTQQELTENSQKMLQATQQIEALHETLAALAENRTKIVKNRVTAIGQHALEISEEREKLQKFKQELRVSEGKIEFLTEMAGLVKASERVQEILWEITKGWEKGVSETEKKRRASLKHTIEKVWTRYQSDTDNWCSLISRSISAMERREILLRKLIKDAEDRYDEADRDEGIAQLERVKVRLEELNKDLSNRREQVLGLFHSLGEWVAPDSLVPNSPEEASPGPSSPSPSLSPSPAQYTIMSRVLLSDTLLALNLDPSVLASWTASIEGTDLVTVADLVKVRSVPSVWNAFLVDKPLLKTELALLLERHLEAAEKVAGGVDCAP